MPPICLGQRLSIAARVFAAVVGGYTLTSLVVAVFALIFPSEPSEAALAATMLSFAIYAGIALSAFAIRSVWRMAASMIAAIVLLRATLWVCDRVVWA
jgi:hypothetical protein